jgi:hypothetical protein
VILAFGHEGDTLVDARTGLVVGEVQILTAQWEQVDDLAGYQARFGPFSLLELRPWPAGVQPAFRF